MPHSTGSAGPQTAHEVARLRAQGLIEESAEALYEHAPCGYLSCLPDGTLVKINATLLSWLGYERGELLYQRRFQHLLTVGGRLYYETHLGPLLQMQGSASEISCQMRCQNGTALPVLVSAVQLTDADGEPLLRRITVFRASERHRYEQELLRAKREAEAAAQIKARFASVMSHELRTPLHAILSIAELLQEEPDPAERLNMTQVLKVAAEDLLALFNQVLDYQKLETTAPNVVQEPVDLRALLERTLAPLAFRATAKGLALRMEIDGAVPAAVLGDGVKLGQVLTNLVGNAIKFTDQGAVTVALRVRQHEADRVALHLAVRDTGVGIAAGQLALIFEEYQQADYGANLQYGGTGLGLAISQQLAGLFGSQIQVRSELNQGTEFYFDLTLPVVPATEAAPPAAALAPLPGLRVLVADDNRYNAFVLEQYLSRWQVSYDVVTDGEQAVRQVQAAAYDLVLLDLQMPVVDGLAALSRIRALPEARFQRLPIVAQSAREPAELRRLIADADFSGYLAKPFRAEQLHAVLALHAPPHLRSAPTPAGSVVSAAPAPVFSLQALRELTRDSPEAYATGLQLLLDNLLSFQAYCARLLAQPARPDAGEFDQQAHRLKLTLHHLQAHALQASIGAVQHALHQLPVAADLAPALRALHAQTSALIGAVQVPASG